MFREEGAGVIGAERALGLQPRVHAGLGGYCGGRTRPVSYASTTN